MFILESTASGGLCSHGPAKEDICPDDCPAPLTLFGARQYVLGDFHRSERRVNILDHDVRPHDCDACGVYPAAENGICRYCAEYRGPTSIDLMSAEDVQFLWETFT